MPRKTRREEAAAEGGEEHNLALLPPQPTNADLNQPVVPLAPQNPAEPARARPVRQCAMRVQPPAAPPSPIPLLDLFGGDDDEAAEEPPAKSKKASFYVLAQKTRIAVLNALGERYGYGVSIR